MFLQSFRIDRFGSKINWQFNGLCDGIQVLHGAEASGKRTLQQFLRAILFGFDDTAPRVGRSVRDGQVGGAVTFQTADGLQTIRRYDDGTVDGHLTIEDQHGRMAGQHHLDTLLAGTSADRFDHLFAVDFSARPEVERLISHAKQAGVEWGRNDHSHRVVELRSRLDRMQHEFDSLPASIPDCDTLARRRRELTVEIDALEKNLTHTRTAVEHDLLVEPRDRIETDLTQARQRLQQLEHDRESVLARRDQLPLHHRNGKAERSSVALEIEERIDQWRQLLTEIAENKRSVQDDLAKYDGAAGRSANPRKPLQHLETRIAELESRLSELDRGECVCRPLQGELRHTVGELRQEIHTLCEELGRWELSREYQSFAHQLQHLNRCESELQVMVDSLLESRAAMGETRIDRWCQCETHPSDSVASSGGRYRRQRLSEIDAELAGIEKSAQETEARIWQLEAELAELLRQMAQGLGDERGTVRDRLRANKSQLEQVVADLESSELRRSLAEGMAELKLEIRDLELSQGNGSIQTAASRMVRAFSGGEIEQIELDALDTAWVIDRASRRLAWHELGAGGRDQVYLALLVAVQSILSQQDVDLPIVVKDAFAHFEAENVGAAAAAICDEVGSQFVVLTRHQHVADVFRRLRVPVRSLDGHLNSAAEEYDLGRKGADLRGERGAAGNSVFASSTVSDRHVEFQLTEESPIENAPSISAAHANQFRKIGVSTVGQLLEVLPSDAAVELGYAGVTDDQVRTWQAQSRLMCRVPHLRAYDARILVACDLTDPVELRAISPRRLREIVHSFAESRRGKVLLMSGTELELSRVTDWMTTSSSESDERLSRQLHRGAERRSQSHRPRSDSGSRSDQSRRTDERPRRRRGEENGSAGNGRSRQSRDGEERSSDQVLKMQQDGDWKFYLNLEDPVVDAPSIGPRSAERLEAIGINTVSDLLNADAEVVAQKLGQKRITGELILQWQQQTTLATRIPQLRGHDAQILVALGIVEPGQLAETDPSELWAQVKPFVKTNQGKRIIRNGKQPDLNEVGDWIQFAAAARTLLAA